MCKEVRKPCTPKAQQPLKNTFKANTPRVLSGAKESKRLEGGPAAPKADKFQAGFRGYLFGLSEKSRPVDLT